MCRFNIVITVTEVKNQQNRANQDNNFHRDEVTRLRTTISDAREKLNGLEATNSQLEGQVKDLNHQLEGDTRSYEQSLNERDAVLRKMRDECQMLVSELQNLLETKQMLGYRDRNLSQDAGGRGDAQPTQGHGRGVRQEPRFAATRRTGRLLWRVTVDAWYP